MNVHTSGKEIYVKNVVRYAGVIEWTSYMRSQGKVVCGLDLSLYLFVMWVLLLWEVERAKVETADLIYNTYTDIF